MTVTFLGSATLVLMTVILIAAPRHYAWLLSAAMPFARSSAIEFSGNGIPPFYIVAIPATAIALISWARGKRIHQPFANLLLIFIAWSLLVTAVSPVVFAGIPVLAPRGGMDQEVLDPAPLSYSISLVAQLVYLVLGVGVVFYLAQRRSIGPDLPMIGIATGSVLSIAHLSPQFAPILDAVFRSYGDQTFNVWEQRHYGIFSEPSYLATFSVMSLGFLVFRVPHLRGWRRVFALSLTLAAGINLVLSQSGTGALAAVILIVCGVITLLFRTILANAKIHPAAVLATLAALVVVSLYRPITQSIAESLVDKVGSRSFFTRANSNDLSLEILSSTFGVGSGLGSSRPSSFLYMVVSNVGLIGAALLFSFLTLLIWRTLTLQMWRASAVALFALLVAKTIAEPNLSAPPIWLLAGVCLHALVSAGAGRGQDTRAFSRRVNSSSVSHTVYTKEYRHGRTHSSRMD